MKTRKNISREKARKSLFDSESAGATVVAAILLLSIIFTVLAVVRTEYVPMWKNDAEQSHMSEVQKDMAELKSTADMVSLLTSSDSNISEYGFPVTVSFSMGGGEIPIMEASKSSGTLSLNTERCKMIIAPESDLISNSSEVVDCGGITYYSNNREYLDQIFRYENGALILSQEDRSLMRQFPSFKIKRTTRDNFTVSINAIKMKGDPDSISSNTDASLRLTGLYAEPVYDSNDSGGIDSFACAILTEYPDAWISYLNETAKNADLEYGTDYDLYKVSSDTVYFSVLPESNKTLERLYVSKSVIQAELVDGISLEREEVNESGSDENESVMKLGKWYYFNEVSNSSVDLSLLEANVSGLNLSKTGTAIKLNGYSSSSNYSHNLNNPLNLTFGFTNFTEFKPSSPNSVTLVMIYQPTFSNPSYGNMHISGKELEKLNGNSGGTWYLYNQTVTGVSISDPSNLTFDLKIGSKSGNGRNIKIDYLAVLLN